MSIMKPTSQIKARLGIEPYGRVHKMFTQICADHMDKFIPEKTGILESNKEVLVDRVIYKSRYAHYQYKGELYVDAQTGKGAFYSNSYGFWSRPKTKKIPSGRPLVYKKPGTGNYWDQRMWSAERQDVINELQAYMRR